LLQRHGRLGWQGLQYFLEHCLRQLISTALKIKIHNLDLLFLVLPPGGSAVGGASVWISVATDRFSSMLDAGGAPGCSGLVPGAAVFPDCFGSLYLLTVVFLWFRLLVVFLVPLIIFFPASAATHRLFPQHFTTSLRRFLINTIVRRGERLLMWRCFCNVASLRTSSNEFGICFSSYKLQI
jgi:hypothetical protein